MQGRHTAHRNTTDFSLCSDSPARAHCSLLDVTSEDTARNLHDLPSINMCTGGLLPALVGSGTQTHYKPYHEDSRRWVLGLMQHPCSVVEY